MVEAYRSQGGAGSSPVYSGASPEAFGAAVGRGLEEAGQGIDRMIHQRKERDRDAQQASAAVEYAKISNELDVAAIDAREKAGPGGAGHSEGIGKSADERISKALGGIKDERIRAAFQGRYEALKGNIFGREYAWERAAHSEKLASDVAETTRTLATGQAANPDPIGLQVSLETVETVWNGLSVADSIKQKGIKQSRREITAAWGNAMIDKDPATLEAALQKGLLSRYLEPEDITALRNGAQVEIRRQEAAAKAKQARDEAEARETIAGGLNRVNDGYVPSTEEWAKWEGLAKTHKLEGKEWDLGVAKDRVTVNRETRDWTPAQWDSSINELRAKGDKRSQAENVRLKHLEAAAPAARARFNNDPHGAAANAGDPPPAIDWSNPTPAAGAARASWHRAWRQATGGAPALLGRDEVEQFKQRAGAGVGGQLEVARILQGTFGTADAELAVRQIDPNNKALQLMVGLPAQTARDYKLGLEAYQRNNKLIDAELGREIFADYAQALPQEMRGVVWDAARAIAAAELDRGGQAEPDADAFGDTFRRALHRAVGASGGAGGFVRWGERPIIIPPDMAKDEALRRLINAGAPSIKKAGGGEPYYQRPDGTRLPMNDNQISLLLKQGTLETVGPGIFRVLGRDGGHAVNSKGGFWQFDIRKLR